MKLQTLIPVTYNDGIVSQTQGIVVGELLNCNQQLMNNDSYNYNFQYSDIDGKMIKMDMFTINEPEITALYNAVKDSIPSGLSYTEQTKMLYYLGFQIQMATTFGIQVSDIELI